MTILVACSEGLSGIGPSEERSPPVAYPKLQHLTLSPLCSEISHARFSCPHLTSLHLVLDNRGDAFDTGSTEGLPLNDIRSGLRSLILSGYNSHVNTALLLQCIIPATSKISCLPQLTIRDMIVIMDINYGVERLPGDGRFEQLQFDNVKCSFTDEITLSGPSEPIDLSRAWKALPRLCERADTVRLKKPGEDRRMEAYEWEEGDEQG